MTDANQTTVTDQDQAEATPETVAPTPQKAGFKAVAEPEETTGTNALAAQEALDRKEAAAHEDAANNDNSQDAQAAALPVQTAPQTSVFTKPDAAANAACLKALAEVFETDSILNADYLASLSLVCAAPGGVQVRGVDNEYVVGKDFIEAEKDQISARAALEMALLAKANPVIEARGVEVTGDLRERYLLTLAAKKLNLTIQNPVEDADIPASRAEEFKAIKAEWIEVLKDPKNEKPAAPATTEEKPLSQTMAEAVAAQPTVDITKADDTEQPQADKPLQAPAAAPASLQP